MSETEILGNSGSIDNIPADTDSCSYSDILQEFNLKSIACKETVSTPSYVINLSSDRSFRKVAAATTDNVVRIYQISETKLARTHDFQISTSEQNSMCGIEFSKLDDNALYVGTIDGNVELFDLRKNDKVCTYTNKTSDRKPPYTCFSVNSNGRILCAGTEQVADEVYLLFFDTRQRKFLGAYTDSHQDDITDLKFHPENSDQLISGSTDGLINVFDISRTDEDDAIDNVLNTESSVQRLQWHGSAKGKWTVSCITHTNDLQLYEPKEGDLLQTYSRSDVTNAIRRKSMEFCNLINCHTDQKGGILLLAGSFSETETILRSVKIKKKALRSLANYQGNKQIVRDSIYNSQDDFLISGGECGNITLWRTMESK